MYKASGPDVNAFPPMTYRRRLCEEEWKRVQFVTSRI